MAMVPGKEKRDWYQEGEAQKWDWTCGKLEGGGEGGGEDEQDVEDGSHRLITRTRVETY